ncbi:putative integral membrane transmembrane protein [Oxalobacteraceae bacterium IMCC9480]|nr:putative integral membrane transmembrane protein [Oxalobacteraceae bacterium IMCC9480]
MQNPADQALNIRLIISGLVLVILLGAIEQTVVAVALPVIAGQLNGFAQMAWVISAYLVACTVATPIWGKLSDIHGRSASLSAAIIIFTLGSLGCALAMSMPQLIGFRVLQGLGGGGLISVAQATIANVVPLRERGRYQGYISGVYASASLAGPILGGYLTHYLSWRYIFWINLPLGLLALWLVRRSLRNLPVTHAQHSVDYVGAVLFATGLTSVLIAMTRLGQGVALVEPFNLLLAIVGVTMLVLFGWHSSRSSEPLIPLSLFRNKTVTICCAVLFLAFFQFISMSVLLPLRLQLAGGMEADSSALRLLPLTLAIPLGAFLAGRLMSATGHYKMLQLGGAIAATAGGIAMALCPLDQPGLMVVALVVLGVGLGFQFPTSMVATQNAVSVGHIGVATALTSLSRLLGGAVGVALLSSLLTTLLRHALPDAPVELFASLMSDASGRVAADGAFRQLFLISAACSALAPLLILQLSEKELRGKPVPSGAPAKS